jgi:glutathione S-transferase
MAELILGSSDSCCIGFTIVAIVSGPKEKFMFTLYMRSGSGSAAVEAVLAECGVESALVEVPRSGQGFEDYLSINPRGEVPSLRLPDHSLMTESGAMVIYLADIYPEAKLAPSIGSPLRARYLRWMLYFASAVYMADLRYFYAARYSVDAAAEAGIKAKAEIDLNRDFDVFSTELGQGPYVLGEIFSAVDLYAAMLISWAPDIKSLFARHPNIETHYNLVAARTKTNPIWKSNNMLFS